MADLPFPSAPSLRARLEECLDPEGKIPRAIEALGPVAGRDVALLDADGGWRARQLVALGARVIALAADGSGAAALRREFGGAGAPGAVTVSVGSAGSTGLPDGSVDAVVSFWTGIRGGATAELAEADRILRPGGRLLVVHEYARDDVSRFRPGPVVDEAVAWSRRDGWFLRQGFKIRVLHAWWRFPDLAGLRDLLVSLFGDGAAPILHEISRPRLSWKVVVYHRVRQAGPI